MLRVWPFDITFGAPMKRDAFLKEPEVQDFIAWLSDNLPKLPFKLRFKSSMFVPGGLEADVVGIEQVIGHYHWKDNWGQTRDVLGKLREQLSSALDVNDEQTLQVCLDILRWGGVRGAIPFLHRLAADGALSRYLNRMARLMSLDGGNDLDDLDASSVERFDAGLTKIHAVLDTSGSPIYDSRVGAAIAMLYSLFRKQWSGGESVLMFPSGAARGDQIRNPGAFVNGLPAPQFSAITYAEWARCQVQLGWIIRAVLERTNWFAGQGALPARCHAFEASLFVLGYDLRCFGIPLAPGFKAPEPQVGASGSGSGVNGWVPTGHPFRQVISDYLTFRRSGGLDNKAAFVDWLVNQPRDPTPLSRASALGYCFAFSIQEFDLFGRSLAALERIAKGGEDGLRAALATEALEPFAVGDERVSVCLVDVWLTGKAYATGTMGKERIDYLLNAGYAGTENSAKTLLAVGRNVGTHFGLLGEQYEPTALFERFYKGFSLHP